MMQTAMKKMRPTRNKFYDLPDELVREINSFRPRNDTAQIIVDANAQDKLRLNYVIRTRSNPHVWQALRPLKIGSNTYGDDEAPMRIIRNNVSYGEKMRLRAVENIKQ